MNTTLILVGLAVLLVALVVWMYNTFIQLKNNCREAWSDIQVQLKRRYDLIPNLMSAVKGYAKHEDAVFEKVSKARSEAMQGGRSLGEQAKEENMLSGALKGLFAIAESYPELKADANFRSLMDELTDTEDKIAASRRFYNMNVRELNIKIESLPWNLVAPLTGATKQDFFEAEEGERNNVNVSF